MKRRTMTFLAAVSALMALAYAGMAEAAAGRSCADLANLNLGDTHIETAERISGDPAWEYPPSPFNIMAPTKSVDVPFCRVKGVIGKEINFEVWLPEDWNGKFQGVGNGGLSGALNYPALDRALQDGYAAASTDTGHKTPKNMFGADWIEGHAQRIVNFGNRAHHLMAMKSKEIVAAFYGEPAEYAYFNGCSSGGWQGLTEAQKYPADYDGIIAGAPAHDWVRLQSNGILMAQKRMKNPAGNLSEAQAQMLADEAVKACDADDGVEDGLISDPLSCDFDPASLMCTGDESSENCLSRAQVERARWLYGPRQSDDGLRLYPGPAYGVPVGGGQEAAGGSEETAMEKMMATLNGEPQWTVESFDPDTHIPQLEKVQGPVLSSMDPDIEDYKEKGGKILVYHGWLDPGISPYHSIQYYRMVAEVLGEDEMDAFYRMFFVPGMGHCGGGPGPNEFDMVTALENWVEDGEAPTRITAVHRTEEGEVDMSRPLCPYPQVARYDGSGSTDEAENFTCEMPR